MKKKVAALTLMLAIALSTTAMAGTLSKKTIDVYTGVEIYVDGVAMQPTDSEGKPVETFIYNGTTYVPLRAVSQSLNYAVNWDGANRRVYIGEMPGQKQYLNDVCPPYQTSYYYSEPTTVTMAGNKYAHAIKFGDSDGYAIYNLDGKYSTLEFDIGHVDGEGMDSATFNFYLDGQLSFSLDVEPEMLPQHYSIPLYNALQMKIEGLSSWGRYALANVEIR